MWMDNKIEILIVYCLCIYIIKVKFYIFHCSDCTRINTWHYNYSTTTSKYLNRFLEMIGYKEIANSKSREKAIEKGMFYSGNKTVYVSVDDTL